MAGATFGECEHHVLQVPSLSRRGKTIELFIELMMTMIMVMMTMMMLVMAMKRRQHVMMI